jgi:hypothetical protein
LDQAPQKPGAVSRARDYLHQNAQAVANSPILPAAGAALMDAGDFGKTLDESIDPKDANLFQPVRERWTGGRWGGIRDAWGRAKRDLGGWISRRSGAFFRQRLPGALRDLRQSVSNASGRLRYWRGRAGRPFQGSLGGYVARRFSRELKDNVLGKPARHLRGSLRGLGSRIAERARGLRSSTRGVVGATLGHMFKRGNRLNATGLIADAAGAIGSAGVFAKTITGGSARTWETVAGVGDAVGGAVDLIKFPKTVSTAIRRYNLGSKLQTVSKLAKVSGALAIVGGTLTAVTEIKRAREISKKNGGLTEEAGIAYANAAAGILSAVAGAALLIPLAQPVAPVLFAASGIIQGATWLYANRKRIKKWTSAAGKSLSGWASKAQTRLSSAIKSHTRAVSQVVSTARTKLTSRFSAMSRAAGRSSRRVLSTVKRLFSPLRKAASRVKNATSKFKKSLGNLFKRRAKPGRTVARRRTLFRRTHRVLRRSRSIRGRRPAYRGSGH